MFRPPVNRAMRVLDRSFFKTKPTISAAKVFDVKKLSKVRGELTRSRDILNVRQLAPIQSISATENAAQSADTKCILLQPEIRHDGMCRIKSCQSRGLMTDTLQTRRLGVRQSTSSWMLATCRSCPGSYTSTTSIGHIVSNVAVVLYETMSNKYRRYHVLCASRGACRGSTRCLCARWPHR